MHRCRFPGTVRTTSISARAFVSTTCELNRFPLAPTTPSVQVDAWASRPIYLSIGVLLSGCTDLLIGQLEPVRSWRRTPPFF